MKINLILPRLDDNIDVLASSSIVSDIVCRLLGWGKTSYTPPLSLLMLGAVTPPDIEVHMVDERIEPINFDEPTDLVGISVVTRGAPRAYEIADEYRKRGVKVVMGGIHPSAMYQEVAPHADAIVQGEGEAVWPELLDDFRQGVMKPLYKGRPAMNLDELPLPRRELIRQPDMYTTSKVLTATRGCPNTCTFCAAGVGLSKKYRKRSVPKVIEELEMIPGKLALFMDDNLGWDEEYSKDLMRAMIPLRLRWYGAVSSNTLEDPELMELAAKSGCFMLGFGFENISPKVLASIRKDKTNKPERYAQGIKRLQEAGIIVWGSFILGFDEEDINAFPALLDFINETNMEVISIYMLTPYPGSVLWRKMAAENRVFHHHWQYFDPVDGTCVFLPRQMTPEQLMEGYKETVDAVFSFKSIVKRMMKSPNLFSFGGLAALHMNLENRGWIPRQKSRAEEYKQEILSQYWPPTSL